MKICELVILPHSKFGLGLTIVELWNFAKDIYEINETWLNANKIRSMATNSHLSYVETVL